MYELKNSKDIKFLRIFINICFYYFLYYYFIVFYIIIL